MGDGLQSQAKPTDMQGTSCCNIRTQRVKVQYWTCLRALGSFGLSFLFGTEPKKLQDSSATGKKVSSRLSATLCESSGAKAAPRENKAAPHNKGT